MTERPTRRGFLAACSAAAAALGLTARARGDKIPTTAGDPAEMRVWCISEYDPTIPSFTVHILDGDRDYNSPPIVIVGGDGDGDGDRARIAFSGDPGVYAGAFQRDDRR
jgi:hypothetical protein